MNEWIRQALTERMDLEYDEWERKLTRMEEHVFSYSFEQRMKKIFPAAEKPYVIIRRHAIRRAVLIVALMILAASVVIAITAPKIYYMIQKSPVSWDVHFFQEDPQELIPEEMDIIVPDYPEGFSVTNTEQFPGAFIIDLKNESGAEITYNQIDANSGITLDAEGELIQEEVINGINCVVTFDKGRYTLVFDNGYYVFLIEGDCSLSILKQMMEEIINQQ